MHHRYRFSWIDAASFAVRRRSTVHAARAEAFAMNGNSGFMKIASSSAGFAHSIAAGELTQLEWLDICANELEVDAVVFAAAHFPRTDDEYLAQLKKLAADLGLIVAAVAADVFAEDGERWLDVARTLGAPLVIGVARQSDDDPAAWGDFVQSVKTRSGVAKRLNVTLALRTLPGTLCAGVADLKRVAKDVDSAWLRFALDASSFGGFDPVHDVLSKVVIAIHTVTTLQPFAQPEDEEARNLIALLERFRGCIVIEHGDAGAAREAYHHAIRRFASLRARALEIA